MQRGRIWRLAFNDHVRVEAMLARSVAEVVPHLFAQCFGSDEIFHEDVFENPVAIIDGFC